MGLHDNHVLPYFRIGTAVIKVFKALSVIGTGIYNRLLFRLKYK